MPRPIEPRRVNGTGAAAVLAAALFAAYAPPLLRSGLRQGDLPGHLEAMRAYAEWIWPAPWGWDPRFLLGAPLGILYPPLFHWLGGGLGKILGVEGAMRLLIVAAVAARPFAFGRAARGLGLRRPDVLTDQTSAHDALNGYVPNGMTLAQADALRRDDPEEYVRRSVAAMGAHVEAMLALQRRGAVTFDYGNNIRAHAVKAGVANAFDIPGFVPEYIRPLFCEGKGPFRWAALSGDPADIRATDEAALEMFEGDAALCRWVRLAGERVAFQGLPARISWLGYGERARFGLMINEMVARGEITADGRSDARPAGCARAGTVADRHPQETRSLVGWPTPISWPSRTDLAAAAWLFSSWASVPELPAASPRPGSKTALRVLSSTPRPVVFVVPQPSLPAFQFAPELRPASVAV